MFKNLIGAFVGLAMMGVVLLAPTVAHASLIGDSVTCAIVGGPASFACIPGANTVGAGVEFSIDFLSTPSFTVDIGASSVSVTQVFGQPISTGAGEVLVLGDLDWIGLVGKIVGISGFSTNVATGNITAGDVTFTDHEVRFDMSPNIWQVGTFASWDLVTQHIIPEPGTLALFGIGLAGLGFTGWRRRRSMQLKTA